MANIIEVRNLTKTFGDIAAVKDVSFSVEEGGIFAFLGPNGAGKSTTIKMLTTLLRPSSGTMRIAGRDPVMDPDLVRHSFGIVFQDPSLDEDLTAVENLELHGVLYNVPRATLATRIEELLALVELSDRRNDFVRDFSGGMKRRLEIARGLLHHPKIIFLDEPTLGLDPQTRNHLWSYVQKLNANEGITVFLTTHYMEEAERIARHIAIIDNGVIVAQGTGEALRKQTGTATLEEAFLALTGSSIRDEGGSRLETMRSHHQVWSGSRR
ncbi:MAG: ATP-binding cassette domain-containing protein [Patescibacteria group bacterium]|nr:ATP-binding cassette domain-containing protein [Patescibacteria group bacterium]